MPSDVATSPHVMLQGLEGRKADHVRTARRKSMSGTVMELFPIGLKWTDKQDSRNLLMMQFSHFRKTWFLQREPGFLVTTKKKKVLEAEGIYIYITTKW